MALCGDGGCRDPEAKKFQCARTPQDEQEVGSLEARSHAKSMSSRSRPSFLSLWGAHAASFEMPAGRPLSPNTTCTRSSDHCRDRDAGALMAGTKQSAKEWDS